MDVLMPQLGETVAEGKITKWFKAAGEPVKPGDNLFEIETDKVSMEVPSTTTGVLSEIRVAAGDVAPVGAVVAVIADGAAAQPSQPAAAFLLCRRLGNQPTRLRPPRRQHRSCCAPQQTGPIKLDPFFEVRTPARNFGPARLPGGTTITPLARRLAAEAGIDLSRTKAPARMAASSRATSTMRRVRRRRRVARSPKAQAPTRSRRSTPPAPTKKCRSTACAAPLRRG